MESILNLGVIRAMPVLLNSDSSRVVMRGLELLDWILRKGDAVKGEYDSNLNPVLFDLESEGVIKFIEALQQHPNDDIYKKVSNLIDRYFISES